LLISLSQTHQVGFSHATIRTIKVKTALGLDSNKKTLLGVRVLLKRYAIVTCEFTFEASHFLPGHRGQCQRPHGHTYRLQISLRGPIIEAPGDSTDSMVLDIEDFKHSVNRMIFSGIPDGKSYDRLNQNNLDVRTGIRTTTGNLAHWIWDTLVAEGVADQLLYRIRLWDTETEYAEITHAERETDGVTYKGFD